MKLTTLPSVHGCSAGSTTNPRDFPQPFDFFHGPNRYYQVGDAVAQSPEKRQAHVERLSPRPTMSGDDHFGTDERTAPSHKRTDSSLAPRIDTIRLPASFSSLTSGAMTRIPEPTPRQTTVPSWRMGKISSECAVRHLPFFPYPKGCNSVVLLRTGYANWQ